MAKISTYAVDTVPTVYDKVIGTEVDNEDLTKNYTISSIISLGVDAGVVKLISPDNSIWTLAISDAGVISASK
jgi:hypothetical protein|tara:strand:- start:626 stop:844 length:219 start_codon:yes stop_codon:yes gene_type:complete